MGSVRCLSAKDFEDIIVDYVERGKDVKDPDRRLKLYCYKKHGNTAFLWFLVVLEISKEQFQLLNTFKKSEAENLFYFCCNIMPCFWSVTTCIPAVFTVEILTKLVDLIKQHKDTWSVAHMCVSLPLPEETMMVLLTSDSFNDHFTSTHHPKGYTLLHLAVELKSVSICKIILECSDFLGQDPGILVENNEKMSPFQLATSLNAKECVAFLKESQSQSWSKNCLSLLEQFQKALKSKKTDTVRKMIEAAPDLVKESFLDGCSCLHKAFDHQTIMYLLEKNADPSTRNSDHDAPLHAIIKRQGSIDASTQKASAGVEDKLKKASKEKLGCVVALLTHKKCNPNCKTKGGMTPLHLAVEECDLLTLKALLIFGADISLANDQNKTPLDLAKEKSFKPMIELLEFASESASTRKLYTSVAVNPVTTGAHVCTNSPIQKGDRVLCLDGGGIKGLILIEMLMIVEQITGKKIVELFDWIIGTSTGGILALAMVYTNLTLCDLRCLYFGLKDKVFHKVGDLFPHCNTEALEKILKDAVGEQVKLGSKSHPKVLITATDIEDFPSKLVFFNNYEEDRDLGKDQYVWKAARATSAAPVYFEHFGKFIDGGIKANNPSMDGMTRIHQYYKGKGSKLKLSCVVSMGCGIFQRKMENTDVHNCWSKIKEIKKGIANVVEFISASQKLLSDVLIHEVSESNGAPVDNARTFCESHGVPFYRFSPKLDEAVNLDEQNVERLVNALIATKYYIMEQIDQFKSFSYSLKMQAASKL